MRVIEAQYDDAVRTRIDGLYTAFVDVQEARTQARFANVALRGMQDLVRLTETLFKSGQVNQAEFTRIKTERDLAASAARPGRDHLPQGYARPGKPPQPPRRRGRETEDQR